MKSYLNNNELFKTNLYWNENIILNDRILNICSQIGLQISQNQIQSFQYDGEYLYVKYSNYSNIIHDIGHFLVAPEERKYIIDFGLGRGPDSIDFIKPMVKSKDGQLEEQLASVMGIEVERHLGCDINYTLHHHDWVNCNNQLYIDSIKHLHNLKLLIDNKPYCFK